MDDYTEIQKKSLEASKKFVEVISPEELEELMSEFDDYEIEGG